MAAPKMHADELDISSPLVRRLLTVQFPAWATLPINPVTPLGTDNALFRLGEDMVVRLPRRHHNVASLIKECTWLPKLAPFLPLAIPTPIAMGVPGENYPLPWAVLRWLEGEMATPERIADPGQAAVDLAAFIAALQHIDPANGPHPTSPGSRGVPLAQRDAATRAAIAALGARIDAHAVTAAWDEALRAPEWGGPPVWIHGDLDARNMLVQDGQLSAVLDFGTLSVGDPASDVMVAWKLFAGDARATFRESVSVDGATWTRSRGWALSQALMALSYYTVETNAILVHEAQRWMEAVLIDSG